MKRWLIGNDPDAGRDWGQEENGGDRWWDGWMASPTQWTYEFEQTPGGNGGQRSLACYSPKHQTQHRNWTTASYTVVTPDHPAPLTHLLEVKWEPSTADLSLHEYSVKLSLRMLLCLPLQSPKEQLLQNTSSTLKLSQPHHHFSQQVHQD